MARYIDADKIVYWVRYVSSTCLESDVRRIAFLDEIERMPTEDVVPVVRCKDCKNYNTTFCANGFGWCEHFNSGEMDENYCSYGERKDAE